MQVQSLYYYPVKSLSGMPGGVIFGMNAIHDGDGPVCVGDSVSFDDIGEKQ